MVKITNGKLVSVINALNKLSTNETISFAISRKIKKDIQKLSEIYTTFRADLEALRDKHAIRDEKGEIVYKNKEKTVFTPIDIEEYNKDSNEILNAENEVLIELYKPEDFDNVIGFTAELQVMIEPITTEDF